jgi:iron complex outermembrane receptor protein
MTGFGEIKAQGTLYGKVEDKNGHPLAAANIFIPELEKRVITDSSGKFYIRNAGNRSVRIECSMIGFATLVQQVDMNHGTHNIILSMEPTSVAMQEIVVTSNQTQLAKNIPYIINSLNASDLKRSPHATLLETMANQPGIDIISGGSGIGKPVIRGLSFNRIVLYSMGTKIENQQWDDDHDAGISEAGIEKVEVVYGPSALIYGADALGGAVIFVDEKPAPAGKTMGKAGLSWFSNSRGINVNAGLKSTGRSGFFYMANFSERSHADYLQGRNDENNNDSRYAINSRFNNTSVKFKAGLSRKWGVSKLSYSYLRSLTGMIVDDEEDSAANAEGKPYNNNRRLHAPYQEIGIHILSSENTILTGGSKININTAWQVNNRKEFEPVAAGDPEYVAMGLLLNTFTYDAKWSTNNEDAFGVCVGTQGMMQVNKNFGNNIGVPDARVNDFAGYALVHYNSPEGKWNLLSGVRFDIRSVDIKKTSGLREGEATLDSLEQTALNVSTINHPLSEFKKYYYPFSFSIGAAYHPAANLSMKANLATGFSAPNYAELSTFGKHEGTYRFEVGNPGLNAEQNIEGEINTSWDNAFISLNFSAFYNYVRNYIYLAPTPDSIYDLQVIAFKQDNASIKGGEFAVGIHPRSVKWLQLNTALTVSSGKIAGSYLPYFPPGKLISEIKLDRDSLGKLGHSWFSLMMNRHFAQDHPALYEESTAGYTLFDTQVGTEINFGKTNVTIELFCSNIFNKAYFNHLSIAKDIPVFEKGRNAGIKLHVPFGG